MNHNDGTDGTIVRLYTNTPIFDFLPTLGVSCCDGQWEITSNWEEAESFDVFSDDPYSPAQAARAFMAEYLHCLRRDLMLMDDPYIHALEREALKDSIIDRLRPLVEEAF